MKYLNEEQNEQKKNPTSVTLYGDTGTGKTFLSLTTTKKIGYLFCGAEQMFYKSGVRKAFPDLNGIFVIPESVADLNEFIKDIKREAIEFVIIEGVDLLAEMIKNDTSETNLDMAGRYGDLNMKGYQKVINDFKIFIKNIQAVPSVKRILFIAHEKESNEKIVPSIDGKIGNFVINHASIVVGRIIRNYEGQYFSRIDCRGGVGFLTKTTGCLEIYDVPFKNDTKINNCIDRFFDKIETSIQSEIESCNFRSVKLEEETEFIKGIYGYNELFEYKDNPAFSDRFKEIYKVASTNERQEIDEFVLTQHSDLTILLSSVKRELGSVTKKIIETTVNVDDDNPPF